MKEIEEKLFALADKKYAAFSAKLSPAVNPARFIGVRLPVLRQLAKELKNSPGCTGFLYELPHKYYDENCLHSLLLNEIADFDTAVSEAERFLPYVDNWAACDSLRPKVFGKNTQKLLPYLKKWIRSPEVYTCRFGIEMLMTHYLDARFSEEYLALAASARSEEYYVRMMVAWFFATALAKQWDCTIKYIENRQLSPWIHRKTIQKAIESYRISEAQKAYLKSLR